MRLRRRKADAAPAGRRRRNSVTADEAPSTFLYRSQRMDGTVNTGRKEERESARPQTGVSWLQRSGLIILTVALLISAINVLTLSSQAKVVIRDGSGDAAKLLREPNEYEAAASKALAGSVWNRNKITVDTGSVTQELQAAFPEIANVSVSIPWLAHRPIVKIQPARPAVILSTADGAYLLDDRGVALSSANTAADLGAQDVPSIDDQSGLKVAVGEQAMPGAHIRFIEVVTKQIAAQGYAVASFRLPVASSQLDTLIANEPFFVKFNLQSNTPREQAGTFLATVKKLKADNTVPRQYIDVRVAGRAYYQ